MVVLDRHLVICVGYIFVCAVLVFSACYIVAICEVGCLARTWCKRGVALVNFQTFPVSCGVTGHVCSLRDMYAWTPDKVKWAISVYCQVLLGNYLFLVMSFVIVQEELFLARLFVTV